MIFYWIVIFVLFYSYYTHDCVQISQFIMHHGNSQRSWHGFKKQATNQTKYAITHFLRLTVHSSCAQFVIWHILLISHREWGSRV